MTNEEKAAIDYARERLSNEDYPYYNDEYEIMLAFEAGVEWCRNNLWKPANGDDLPEIGREVIALALEHGLYKVVFAHRPPERWYGRNMDGEEHVFEPKTYDKGKWNIPNIKWWLDVELPKMEE